MPFLAWMAIAFDLEVTHQRNMTNQKDFLLLSVLGLAFLLSIACSKPASVNDLLPIEPIIVSPSPSPEMASNGIVTLFIPNDAWVRIFFEQINQRANKSGLTSLKDSVMPNGDLEIRFWTGFGFSSLKGFVLKRNQGTWTAFTLRPMSEQENVAATTSFPEPVGGWELFWKRLVEAGVLRLPNAADTDCEGGVYDGECYVVEINTGTAYRTYMYDSPDSAECFEAKKMMEITCLIFGEKCGGMKR